MTTDSDAPDQTSAEKPKGPVRRLFMEVMGHAAHQGWMIGLMDGAVSSLTLVRDDALENLKRVPSHKLSAKAEQTLTKAINAIEDLSAELARISQGQDGG